MHFCENCKNMYYVKLDAEKPDDLTYYCRKCGNENKNIANEVVVVSKTFVHKNKTNIKQFMNEYTKLDPTLPRIKNIECPNTSCITNQKHSDTEDSTEKDKNNEIIYIRYDNENLKYIYMCTKCDHVWNISNA